MSSTSSVRIGINFQGDIEYDQQFNTASNTSSPAMNEIGALTTGNNTISVPTGATGVTIIPPNSNAIVLTLKGVNGDTGIVLSLVNPFYLSLGTSITSFVINVSANVTLRFIWS